jgi:hypothetical protein
MSVCGSFTFCCGGVEGKCGRASDEVLGRLRNDARKHPNSWWLATYHAYDEELGRRQTIAIFLANANANATRYRSTNDRTELEASQQSCEGQRHEAHCGAQERGYNGTFEKDVVTDVGKVVFRNGKKPHGVRQELEVCY